MICRSGTRSAYAAQALTAGGLNAVNVADGMTGWAVAGRPMISEDGTEPHVAYRVPDVRRAIEGHVVLAEPFHPAPDPDFLIVAFVEIDGAVVEFMQYGDPDEEGWF